MIAIPALMMHFFISDDKVRMYVWNRPVEDVFHKRAVPAVKTATDNYQFIIAFSQERPKVAIIVANNASPRGLNPAAKTADAIVVPSSDITTVLALADEAGAGKSAWARLLSKS